MNIYIQSNIRTLRRNNSITQERLSQKTGILHHNIGAYEEGRATPNVESLIKIADHFNITLDALIRTDLSKPIGQ